ncbi:P-loop containing nucleoside triphosphate hydrolases superfamily [Olea europaea subsp. europaea]|uniref:P-loop containing nucleoside triphosphate hydrolases superfamily n=1 Tax=Olea europaea subsp. europaea TaxID=158383 RepID=A0A8S0QJY7_OLEEU|nr:P-loop containing nucleoside triphosphate hydrolases superfamily [Olea europaea subsp. europaea]
MGGDTIFSPISAIEEKSLAEQDFPHESIEPSLYSEDENDPVINGESVRDYVDFSPAERQKRKVYAEVLRSYEELQHKSERLEEAKSKILSYTPGSWIEKVAGMDLSDYDVPKTTTLLLIGPKGSGKSSLVNKISRVLEDDSFAPDRAQVSYDISIGNGTYFLQEYLIPRGSGSFCLYDTRSLSNDSSENLKMLKRWMTKGVRHGELVKRESDCSSLKGQLKCKAQKSRCNPSQVRKINFVIFVVNGLSVLESMDGDNETNQSYTNMIATTFKNPLLSFKDDKPAIVVTHGDLLSLSDRVRVRVHLGKLFGVPPTRQIFDIPESNDSAVALTLVDMLRYSLEHADRNLPGKDRLMKKIYKTSLPAYLLLLLVLGISILYECRGAGFHSDPLEIHLNKATGLIPKKSKATGGASFHSHSSLINLNEATGLIPNKTKETGGVDFHSHSSKTHLDEATGSIPNKRRETWGSDFHAHSSKIHLDEATGSIPNKRKETKIDLHKLDWVATRHLWLGSDYE